MLILYNPPSSAQRKPILPMSLLALGALLEEDESYLIVDGNLETDPLGALDRTLRATGADTLGVTVMPGPQLQDATATCRRLKELHPRLTIVWGGYFPTQHHDVCLRSPFVDFVFRGHAEAEFKKFVVARRTGQPVNDIPGLAWRRDEAGDIVANPQPAIPHPQRLPDFPYHRLDMARYVRRTFLGDRTLSHHSSYGCPFFCNFCAVVNMVNGRWLAQSAERTAHVAGRLVREFGANGIEFFDNNFFVDEGRVVEFAERVVPLNIRWWGEARIDTLCRYTDRTWKLLRQSGLAMTFMGAESGSNETLRAMDKGGTASIEKTLELAARMTQYGIIPEFSFVMGNPPDPEADVQQTIEFIRKVKAINPASEIILYMYTPVPLSGTLYDRAVAEGFRFPETLDEWASPSWQEFSQRRSAHMPWLEDRLRRRVRDFERVLNAYCPTTTDVSLRGTRRLVLKALSAARYHFRLYRYPIELQVLQRLLPYQRPETSGF